MAMYEETTPPVNNDGVILTSTLWNQSGTVYVSVDGIQTMLTGYSYNQYSPYTTYDLTSRSVTGCTNTAHSQILYYWIERGYRFDLSVSETDFYYLRSDNSTHYVSDTPILGEGSMSDINYILATEDPIGNGDFIAALNYFCAVKNHSSFGTSTSTTVYLSVRTDGTNALPFKAVGFDSYFTISDTLSTEKSRYFFSAEGTPSEEGLAILRENLDYGEVISFSGG